jgi:hypothetical protein
MRHNFLFPEPQLPYLLQNFLMISVVVRYGVYSVKCDVTEHDYLYEIAAVYYLISLKNYDVCLYAVTVSVMVTATATATVPATPP